MHDARRLLRDLVQAIRKNRVETLVVVKRSTGERVTLLGYKDDENTFVAVAEFVSDDWMDKYQPPRGMATGDDAECTRVLQ